MILFYIALLCMVLGHIFRLIRQKQFIQVYENSHPRTLLFSLAVSYIINFLLPFKIGEIVRAFILGRKLKNHFPLAFATIVIDRYLDVIALGIICCGILLSSYNNEIIKISQYYTNIGILFLIISTLCLIFKKYVKIFIGFLSSAFNSNTQRYILLIMWNIIYLFKNIWIHTNKLYLLINTIVMWLFYLVSYYYFYLFIVNNISIQFSWYDIWNLLFSNKNILQSNIYNIISSFYVTNKIIILICILYLIIPSLILVLLTFIPWSKVPRIRKKKKVFVNMLPQKHYEDQLAFLNNYFSSNKTFHLNNYLAINSNIKIIKDYSAGSNATTLLCENYTNKFFRKYVFGKDANKLYSQVLWIKKYESILNLPKILESKVDGEVCYYDMEYSKDVVTMFNYIHSNNMQDSWQVLKRVLSELETKLYKQKVTQEEGGGVINYIETKVTKNLEIIEGHYIIQNLLKYDYLIINNKKYKNFLRLKEVLSFSSLYKTFEQDLYNNIHGDLTIENILYNYASNNYLIIDPNNANIHNTKFLDYAKLLQSLQGGYEFLMRTSEIEINENNITYLDTYSVKYNFLYNKYKEYLYENFTSPEIKSIYFHHLIHWIRLLPYKLQRLDERAILFYAKFIVLLNEITEEFIN